MSILMLAVATRVVWFLMERYALLKPAAYIVLFFLGAIILMDKGGEFILWVGNLILEHREMISTWSYRVGDFWKVMGVGGVIFSAIVYEEIHKHRERRKNK